MTQKLYGDTQDYLLGQQWGLRRHQVRGQGDCPLIRLSANKEITLGPSQMLLTRFLQLCYRSH